MHWLQAEASQTHFGRPWPHKVPPVCPSCGYDLRGLTQMRCPECGYRPTFREMEDAAKKASGEVSVQEEARAKLKIHFRAGTAVGLALLILHLLGLGGVAMIVGVFSGLFLIASGVQAWRTPGSRTYDDDNGERTPAGGLLVLLGALLIVISFIL